MGSDNLFHKKKIRKEEELARRKAKKSPYETIYIVCEDGKSVPSYLRQCINHFRLNTANVKVVPSKGSAPISVVEYALMLAKDNSDIDRIAVVIDRDEHESYKRAMNKINQHKSAKNGKNNPQYMIIYSNPCFEIWLLLHYLYTTKAYKSVGNKSAADVLIGDLRKFLPVYSKGGAAWSNDVMSKMENAIINARKLEEYNSRTKSENPATNMHILLEYLKKLKFR